MPTIVPAEELNNVQIKTSADRAILAELEAGGVALFSVGESLAPYRAYAKKRGFTFQTRKHESGGTLVTFGEPESN